MRKNESFITHNLHYVLLFVVLVLGFALMYVFSASLAMQFIILICVLISYMVMGFIHHHFHHDLRAKIVLEYILISLLIMGAYLFMNAGRL